MNRTHCARKFHSEHEFDDERLYLKTEKNTKLFTLNFKLMYFLNSFITKLMKNRKILREHLLWPYLI